jgi:hypothetical protein
MLKPNDANQYNGWTNYATWRINLEIFDGYDPEGQEVDQEWCKDFAESMVFCDIISNSLAHSYASAFLSDVNWYEIAEGFKYVPCTSLNHR